MTTRRGLAWVFVLLVPACSSGMLTPDGGAPGMCGADVPAGQACNTLTNLASGTITPTCATGTAPSAAGGTIVDGTYVLTSQDKYSSSCSSSPFAFSETIAIAGDCMQLVTGGVLAATVSGRITTQGTAISFTETCLHLDVDATVTQDPRMQTYTATSTTLTLFAVDTTTGNTDVSVFTRR